jgi:hypothetical protein
LRRECGGELFEDVHPLCGIQRWIHLLASYRQRAAAAIPDVALVIFSETKKPPRFPEAAFDS